MHKLKKSPEQEIEERIARIAEESVLKEDELKRLRAEFLLRDDLRKLSELSRDKERQRLMDVLNSPFIVSVVGAILIGVIGSAIEAKLADHRATFEANRIKQEKERDRRLLLADRETDRLEQLHQKKLNLLASFSQDFDTFGVTWVNLKQRQAWLASRNPPADPMKRSRSQILGEYEILMQAYLNHPKPTSMISQVQSIYSSDGVQQSAKKLMQATLKLEKAEDPGKLAKLNSETQSEMEKLIGAMGSEVLSDLKSSGGPSSVQIEGRAENGDALQAIPPPNIKT